ncbi:unnamed protein product, partial [Meganyctiphanes norvegica]
ALIGMIVPSSGLYCYNDNLTPFNFFATNTDYQAAKVAMTAPDGGGDLRPGCSVVSLWQYGREGTTIPTEETYTQEIMNRLQQIRNDILENHRKNKSNILKYSKL